MFQIPLGMLKPGEKARVAQLIGDHQQIHRLAELGICKGTCLQVLQAGTPCIVCLGDTRLCFREADALGILVEPIIVECAP